MIRPGYLAFVPAIDAGRLVSVAMTASLLFAAPSYAVNENKEAVQAASIAWAIALNAGDVRSLAALATDEIVLLGLHAEAVRGREASSLAWGRIAEKGLRLELRTDEISVSGNLAYEIGTLSYVVPQGTVLRKRQLLRIWQRSDGNWRIHRSMETSAQPGPDDLPSIAPPAKDPILNDGVPPR